MGSCTIKLNSVTGAVESVVNFDGTPSTLFNELKESLGEKNALESWAVTQTDAFREIYPNDTATPAQTMDYISKNLTKEVATTEDLNTASKAVVSSNFSSIDNLVSALKNIVTNPTITKGFSISNLVNSRIFTPLESRNIHNSPSMINKIRLFYNKLHNFLLKNESSNIDTSEESGGFNIPDSSKINELGKFDTLSESKVTSYLSKNLADAVSDADFNAKVNALEDVNIREALLNDDRLYNMARELTKDLILRPSFKLVNGTLEEKIENDFSDALMNSVTIGSLKTNISEKLSKLETIPLEMWENKDKSIVNLLKGIELDAANNHIDLSGLSGQLGIKSREEIIGLLEVIDDFNYLSEGGDISLQEIKYMVSDINEFFGRPQESQKVPLESLNRKGVNLINVEGVINEAEAYENGIIRLSGNTFQRVQVYSDINSMIEDVYTMIQNDVSLLSHEILGNKIVKSDGKYDFDYLLDVNNKEEIKSTISTNVAQIANNNFHANNPTESDAYKQMIIYKSIVKSPLKTNPTVSSAQMDVNRSNFSGDANYLTSDYISDFYSTTLKNKIENNSLYNNALSYFSVSSNGITIAEQIGGRTQMEIKDTLSRHPEIMNDIVNYSILSKDSSLNFLTDGMQSNKEVFSTIESRRDYAVNNPQTVPGFSGNEQTISPQTKIEQNSTQEFLKQNQDIYELVDRNGGASQYSKIDTKVDNVYNVFNQPSAVIEGINLESYRNTNDSQTVLNILKGSELSKSQKEITCSA